MIEIENLTMCYGELRAVDELNLNVEKGEFFAFLGPNGAGKTTTSQISHRPAKADFWVGTD